MIKQVRVKLENRPGTLERMLAALAEGGVDLKALEVSDRGPDHGEANLIVNDLERATRALDGTQHEYAVTDALAVELDDRVGGLDAVLKVLSGAGVNVQQLYAFVSRVEGKSLALITVDQQERAEALLKDAGVRLFSQKALSSEEPPSEDASALGDHLGLDFIW